MVFVGDTDVCTWWTHERICYHCGKGRRGPEPAKYTIVIAESFIAGLISAAPLVVPGASAYFLGGAVVYTRQSRRLLLDIPDSALDGMRPSTEPYALMMARTAQKQFRIDLGAGRNRRDRPDRQSLRRCRRTQLLRRSRARPKHSMTLETGKSDRLDNMHAFTAEALNFLLKAVAA